MAEEVSGSIWGRAGPECNAWKNEEETRLQRWVGTKPLGRWGTRLWGQEGSGEPEQGLGRAPGCSEEPSGVNWGPEEAWLGALGKEKSQRQEPAKVGASPRLQDLDSFPL